MARWEDALDALTDVYKFWHSDTGARFARGYLADRERKLHDGTYLKERAQVMKNKSEFRLPDGDDEARARVLDAIEHESIDIYKDLDRRMAMMAFNSDPIYVDPDMWRLVVAASRDWPGEGLEPSDLPTDAGFMLLPEPVITHDVWNKAVSIRAVNWHPMSYRVHDAETGEYKHTSEGILLAFYHNTSDKDDYTEAGENRVAPWVLSHAMPWTFSVNDPGGPVYAGFALGMTLQVCWRLMQQEVGVQSHRFAGGQFGKRALRAKLPEKRVTVVTLRRPRQDKETPDEPHAVEWTHRWITSGHWRNQPYASGIHRLIWINPYVKGPAHLPLVIKKVRAFQFVR